MSPPASESAAQRLDAAVEAYTKLLTPDFATDDLFVSADFAPGVGPDFDALMRASPARTDLRVAVMIGPEIRFTLDDDSALTEVRFAQRVLGALRDDARSRGTVAPDTFVHLTPVGSAVSPLAVAFSPTRDSSDSLIRNFELPDVATDFLVDPRPLVDPVLEKVASFHGTDLRPSPTSAPRNPATRPPVRLQRRHRACGPRSPTISRIPTAGASSSGRRPHSE